MQHYLAMSLRDPLARLGGLPTALLSLAAVLAFALAPHAASAQTAPYCAPGQAPTFVFGFAELKATLEDTMGEPLECEHANPLNGDSLQSTSTGLAFYRKSTNTPTFTNGADHWALTPVGVVTWVGDSIDPPGSLLARTYFALGDSLPLGEGSSDPPQLGYVPRVYDALAETGRVQNITNLAVRADTSATFVAPDGQLDRAVTALRQPLPAAPLVTLHIGGNDLLHLLNGPPCQLGPASAACADLVTQRVGSFAATFPRIVRALRDARSDAPLVVLTYYNPFSGSGTPYEHFTRLALVGRDGVVDCDASAADPTNQGLNDVITCSAHEVNATVVDLYPLFEGRARLLTHVVALDAHPTDSGYAVIAEALLQVIAGL